MPVGLAQKENGLTLPWGRCGDESGLLVRNYFCVVAAGLSLEF